MGVETTSGEGWRASVSVSMLLEVTTITNGELDPIESLLLVRDRSDKKWGPPAGHIKESETFGEAMSREFSQETGLQPFALVFEPSSGFLENGGMKVIPICLPGELKSRVGLVYEGRVRDLNGMRKAGWEVTGDEDTDRAKPFRYEEVMALVDSEMVHREEPNATLLVSWLVKLHNSLGHSGALPEVKEEINEWLLTNQQLAKYGTIEPDNIFPNDLIRFVPNFMARDLRLYREYQELDDAEFEEQVRRLKW
jgi:ADP-ribose pyrophosphatase YjhB (NUDIX family)